LGGSPVLGDPRSSLEGNDITSVVGFAISVRFGIAVSWDSVVISATSIIDVVGWIVVVGSWVSASWNWGSATSVIDGGVWFIVHGSWVHASSDIVGARSIIGGGVAIVVVGFLVSASLDSWVSSDISFDTVSVQVFPHIGLSWFLSSSGPPFGFPDSSFENNLGSSGVGGLVVPEVFTFIAHFNISPEVWFSGWSLVDLIFVGSVEISLVSDGVSSMWHDIVLSVVPDIIFPVGGIVTGSWS